MSTIRCYRPGDEEAWLRLHNQCFTPQRSLAHWRWRFRDNPLATTEMVGAFDESDCVAAYAGTTHRFQIDGRPALATVHGDVAVAPKLRSGLGGTRLAIETGRKFAEVFCQGRTALFWGYPQPGIRRLATRFLDVEILEDVVFLVHELRTDLARAAAVEVTTVTRFSSECDALWQQCRPELAASVVRDAAYLNWRYADHPDVDYLALEARDAATGSLRGVAVVRDGGWDDAVCMLMDWLVPGTDRDAEAALVERSLAHTRTRAKRCLVCWLPAYDPRFHRFQIDYGFYAHGTPYQQGVRAWHPGLDRDWLHEHWFRTLGDIDFF